jgi:hypothetical protein
MERRAMSTRNLLLSIGSLAVLGAAAPLHWSCGSGAAAAALEAPPRSAASASSAPAAALELEAGAAAGAHGPSSRSASEPASTVPSAADFEEKYRYADRDALEGFHAGLLARVQSLGTQIMSARMRAGLSTRYQGKVGGPNPVTEFGNQDARYWHPGTEPHVANTMVMRTGPGTYEASSLVVGDYPEFDPLQAEMEWLDRRLSALKKGK